jgi:hypothetical protein
LPTMTLQTAQDVVSLSKDDKFNRLLGYFKAIEAELQIQINSTLTPKDERELLVHIKERLHRDVIEVVKAAEDLLRRKEQLTGQA